MHLETPDGFECVAIVLNGWPALFRRPADDENVEADGDIAELTPLYKAQGGVGKPALFLCIHRGGNALHVR